MSDFTLEEFYQEIKGSPEKFREYWLKQRAKAEDPEMWPISMPEDNAGLFMEAFIMFLSDGLPSGEEAE